MNLLKDRYRALLDQEMPSAQQTAADYRALQNMLRPSSGGRLIWALAACAAVSTISLSWMLQSPDARVLVKRSQEPMSEALYVRFRKDPR